MKKVGSIFITPETLEVHFPKNCVVNCPPIEMKINNFPICLKPVNGIEYEVYAENRKQYDRFLYNLKYRGGRI